MRDDVCFATGMVDVCAARVAYALGRLLKHSLAPDADERPEWLDRRRRRVLTWLAIFPPLARAARGFDALAALAEELRPRLAARWGSDSLRIYPAFADTS